jgi:serine/threonine-protein kinase RsbT
MSVVEMEVRASPDVVRIRQVVREHAIAQGLSLVDQTKIVTAASELARNTIDYGGGGTAAITRVQDGTRKGVRVTFSDKGPGIADVELALKDGYTSGGGLGLGLGGAKRLASEFSIQSAPGQGTRIVITRWRL